MKRDERRRRRSPPRARGREGRSRSAAARSAAAHAAVRHTRGRSLRRRPPRSRAVAEAPSAASTRCRAAKRRRAGEAAPSRRKTREACETSADGKTKPREAGTSRQASESDQAGRRSESSQPRRARPVAKSKNRVQQLATSPDRRTDVKLGGRRPRMEHRLDGHGHRHGGRFAHAARETCLRPSRSSPAQRIDAPSFSAPSSRGRSIARALVDLEPADGARALPCRP